MDMGIKRMIIKIYKYIRINSRLSLLMLVGILKRRLLIYPKINSYNIREIDKNSHNKETKTMIKFPSPAKIVIVKQ